jgi:hypothetical protein
MRPWPLGDRWLRDSNYPGQRLIVLHAANMTQNRRSLAKMAMRYKVVSPQTKSRPHRGGHSVLAVWASKRALQLAEELASPGGGLCLIPGTLAEVSIWISRTRAINLTDPRAEPAQGLSIDPAVAAALDSVLILEGHNRFLGDGKERAVSDLRAMVAAGHRPSPEDLEAFALASGHTDHTGAANLRRLYERVLHGKGFRDYRGRSI